MKEYWVNVYEDTKGNLFQGGLFCDKTYAERFDCKYRLHVKMKDKPGLNRQYAPWNNFNNLVKCGIIK